MPAVPLRNLTSAFCISARKPAPKTHPHSPESPLIFTQLLEGLLTLQGLRFLTTYLLPKQTALSLQPSVRSPSTPALQVPRSLSSTVPAITVTNSHLTALWGRRSSSSAPHLALFYGPSPLSPRLLTALSGRRSSSSAPRLALFYGPSPLSPRLLTALSGRRSSSSAPRLVLFYGPSPLSPLRDVALLSGAGRLQYIADSYPILCCCTPSSSCLTETAPSILILASVLSSLSLGLAVSLDLSCPSGTLTPRCSSHHHPLLTKTSLLAPTYNLLSE